MPIKILVIDDDTAVTDLLSLLLKSQGFEVAATNNSNDGLNFIRDDRPDLVVLDLMMPEMDGFEFVAELRRSESGRRLPVVVVTARDLSADERARLDGQVKRVFRKGSFSREELTGELRRALDAGRRPRGR